MIRRWLPHPALAAFMVLVWMLLLESAAFGVVLLGIILSVAITRWSTVFWADQVSFFRPGLLLKLVPLVLWDILVANVIVAKLILGPNRRLQPGFLAIPLDVTDPHAVTALASIITLTPGTVSAQLSDDARTLYVHALNVSDPDAEIHHIKQRYEAPLKEIFECSPSR